MTLVLLFAPGDRTVTVTGTATGTATASGTVARRRFAAGQSAGSSAATGTATATAAAPGTGFAAGASAATGTVRRTRVASGQSAGTCSLAGTCSVVAAGLPGAVIGTATGTATVTGTAVRTRVAVPFVGVVFGDAEAAVCDILRADAQISAIPGITVGTDLVGFAYPARRLRVTRTGGIPTLWMRLDNPVIAVAAYAPDKGAALDLARAARAAVFSARGLYIGNGLALYDVMDTEGMTWSPDEHDPDHARYVFALALVAKPYEP